jgi:GNAT superfamily N-acetyltransferase
MSADQSLKGTVTIRPLRLNELPAAAAVFAESFRQEGFTRALLNLATPRRVQRFAVFTEFVLLMYYYNGHKILVATKDGDLAGVAIVKLAETKPRASWLRRAAVPVRYGAPLLGMAGIIRWRNALQVKSAIKPPAALPAAYRTLEIIAVAPGFQGQGIGRGLLEHLNAECDSDSDTPGIYLYTADEKNTHIYRRFGYEVLQVKQGGPVGVWQMFRPRVAG